MFKIKPGASAGDATAEFPKYDDDVYESVSLQQFAHSTGLSLYEGMWISRAYSLKYSAGFAIETFAGYPALRQTVRLEHDIVVTKDGYEKLTILPPEEAFWPVSRRDQVGGDSSIRLGARPLRPG